MKYIELILTLPIAIISLFLLMVIDLVRMIQGRPTVDEEWHDIYVDSNMNHGIGRKRNEEFNNKNKTSIMQSSLCK